MQILQKQENSNQKKPLSSQSSFEMLEQDQQQQAVKKEKEEESPVTVKIFNKEQQILILEKNHFKVPQKSEAEEKMESFLEKIKKHPEENLIPVDKINCISSGGKKSSYDYTKPSVESLLGGMKGVANQFLKSNRLTGQESGGNFSSNIKKALCKTDLFKGWHINEHYNDNGVLYLVNKEHKVTLADINHRISLWKKGENYSHGMEIEAANLFEYILLTQKRVPSDRYLIPFVIHIFDQKMAHQLLLEVTFDEGAKTMDLKIWDSLSTADGKTNSAGLAVLGPQFLLTLKNHIEKVDKRIEKVTHEYIHTNFQWPGTGNCTRFSLFFALLRAQGLNPMQYTTEDGNKFCTFIFELGKD